MSIEYEANKSYKPIFSLFIIISQTPVNNSVPIPIPLLHIIIPYFGLWYQM